LIPRSFVARLGALAVALTAAFTHGAPAPDTARAAGDPLHVPVLMYHFIRVNPVASDVLGFHLSVPPRAFAQQIALLSITGHHAVSLDDVAAAMDRGVPLPSNPVVLTFDDGYDNFAFAATPMLRSLGMTGTDFVVPGVTGTPGFMSRAQIAWVVRQGMTIGAHTMHHHDLAQMTDAQASAEIQGSRDLLRQWTGTPVDTFAYPYGSLNAGTPRLVGAAGFVAAVTTRNGAEEDPGDRLVMPRTRVDGGEALSTFAANLGIALPPPANTRFWGLLGDTARAALDGSTTGIASTAQGGYVVTGRQGVVHAFGPAPDAGSITGGVNQPVVGIATSPSGKGYWLVAADGGIFPFGDAGGYGSTGAMRLNKPVVGMAATPTGNGYWLVASDGGIFPFGDAGGYGSTGALRLNKPVVGMAATLTGNGYWLVASDGGVFPFGDAGGYGSTGGTRLNQPIVAMMATPSGHGYWLVAADGGIFPFGDAGGFGSLGGRRLNAPVVGAARSPSGGGYWLAAADGGIFPFGDAVGYGSGVAAGPAQPGALGGDLEQVTVATVSPRRPAF
jgi:peptidoglycan/xylan/chitin deacetylase (PgdA/CDA1 family)